MHENENNNIEEMSLSRSYNDVVDINNDHALAILEPWMLEGLEGPKDDDIFTLKQKSKMDLPIVATPITIMKAITPSKMKKDAINKNK